MYDDVCECNQPIRYRTSRHAAPSIGLFLCENPHSKETDRIFFFLRILGDT